jgi:hypothetical protein
MVGVERFELPTLWSQTRCATRLRYTPNRAEPAMQGRYTLHPGAATAKCHFRQCVLQCVSNAGIAAFSCIAAGAFGSASAFGKQPRKKICQSSGTRPCANLSERVAGDNPAPGYRGTPWQQSARGGEGRRQAGQRVEAASVCCRGLQWRPWLLLSGTITGPISSRKRWLPYKWPAPP